MWLFDHNEIDGPGIVDEVSFEINKTGQTEFVQMRTLEDGNKSIN